MPMRTRNKRPCCCVFFLRHSACALLRFFCFFTAFFPLLLRFFSASFPLLFHCSVHYATMLVSESATRSSSISASWSRLAIFFHWATALAIAIGLLAIE